MLVPVGIVVLEHWCILDVEHFYSFVWALGWEPADILVWELAGSFVLEPTEMNKYFSVESSF